MATQAFKHPEEELQHTLQLLRQEKKAEFEYYRQKVLQSTLEERQKDGICWYPVSLLKARLGAGEMYVVDIERSGPELPHVFNSGKAISLFQNDGDKSPRAAAVVNWVKGNRMRLTLNGENLPDWVYEGKLGVDLLFDEASYKAMEAGMQKIMEAKGRMKELRNTLLGYRTADFAALAHAPDHLNLNPAQQRALQEAVAAKDVAIVHGPPGTGKTTTLVEIIKETILSETQVLVCAPSNAAVDLLADKLSEQGLSVLRIGHPARVNEDMLPYTVDARLSSHPGYKELKMLRRKSEEMSKMASKYKRNFGPSERRQRNQLRREAGSLRAQAEQLEHYLLYDIYAKTQVFCATPVGAYGNEHLQEINFRTVFIDEAGQALEPAAWLPILQAERVIFAGDHLQLPPTIKSNEAARAGLAETLFEKAIKRNAAAASMLEVQYRMHQQIMEFSSRQFYDGKLQADTSVAGKTLLPDEAPVELVDTAGSGFTEVVDRESRSRYNSEEADMLLRHLEGLANRLHYAEVDTRQLSVGIISPYRAQVRALTALAEANQELTSQFRSFDINTVDAFQGQERDIVYISLVRSNEEGEIGFLADIRRMNVALTRAKQKLVVLGDSATFGSHSFYHQFLDYIHEIEAYRSVFEYMHD